ncbi:MAG: GNAT superfamily N-acetyltransferase [Polaribacter sp.]|jgi:GNAT superfamily N-acetyltransferase
MSGNEYTVRRVHIDERAEWETLWLAYLVFYKTELAGSLTDLLWQKIHDCQHETRCYVVEDQSKSSLVGLAHYFPHTDTWAALPVVYLNDLFVDPDSRGAGLGRSLINKIIEDAKENRWGEIYWHTAEQNNDARILYDKLTGGADGFVSYRMDIEQEGS